MHHHQTIALRSLVIVYTLSGTATVSSSLEGHLPDDLEFVHLNVEKELLDLMDDKKPVLIVLRIPNDYDMVLSLLKKCRIRFQSAPIIVVSDRLDKKDVVTLFREGATDVLSKSELDRIPELIAKERIRSIEENHFRTIADFAFGWEVWVSNDKKHNYVSPSCEFISGYSPSEFINDPQLFATIVLEEDKEIWLNHNHESTLELQPRRQIQFRIKRKDGQTVWIEHSCRPVFDPNGELLGYRASNTDVTKRKHTESNLIDSEKKYRDLFNTATDAIYILDVNGYFMDVNQGALDLYGYSKEYFVGKTPGDLAAPNMNDMAQVGKFLSAALKGKPQQFEFWGLRSNGDVFPKIVRVQKGSFNGEDVVIAYALDITERKQAEMKLRAGEQQLTAIMNQASQGITLAKHNGEYVLVNPAFCKMMGYSEPELLGMTVFDMKMDKGDEGLKSFERSKSKTEGVIVEVELKRKDGAGFMAEVSGKPIKIGGDELVLGVITDLTERKQMELALLESQKKFQELFTRSGDAIMFLENGEFTDCNATAVELFGFDTKKKVLSTHPSQLSPEKQPDGKSSYEKAEEMIALSFENGTHRFEWMHTRSDGRLFWAEVLLTAIPNTSETQVTHCVVRDITERKNGERQLQNTLGNLEELVAARTGALKNTTAELEQSHKDFLSSLRYAHRIQVASLPSDMEFGKAFRNHFTIFKPRDIVSGDFYWLYRSKGEVILVLADCTGHGVPGALMSMAGNEQLSNIIIKEDNREPSVILREMDKAMMRTLKREDAKYNMNDGMDMSVVHIDHNRSLFSFSAAQSHGMFIKKGIVTLLKPSKNSIGGLLSGKNKKFAVQKLEFEPGDRFYLYTDGVYDQFGGPHGKKMFQRNLRAKVKETANMSILDQHAALLNWFETWKGNIAQVDDVTIIGVEL